MDNLSHNYHLLRGAIPSDCRFLGVVKADAYGHGAVPVSRQLVDLGADYLAVSNMEEAVQLRRSYIRLPILILGYTPAFYAEDMVDMGIRQEVHSLEYACQLSEALAGSGKRLKIHIKLDTGMSRLGFFADDPNTVEQIKRISAMEGLVPEGIFTHFSVADSLAPADQAFTAKQFAEFTAVVDALAAQGYSSSSGTAAIPRPPCSIRSTPWIWFGPASPPMASAPARSWRAALTCGP